MAVPSTPTLTGRHQGNLTVRLVIGSVSGADEYGIFRDVERNPVSPTPLDVSPTAGIYIDKPVVNATTYWYRVNASNVDGDSDFSDPVEVRVKVAPSPNPTAALKINRAFLG